MPAVFKAETPTFATARRNADVDERLGETIMSSRLKHFRVLGKPYQRGSRRSERSALWLEVERRRIHAIAQTRRRRRSEEHTSELQSLMRISYAVFCLNKKNIKLSIKQL